MNDKKIRNILLAAVTTMGVCLTCNGDDDDDKDSAKLTHNQIHEMLRGGTPKQYDCVGIELDSEQSGEDFDVLFAFGCNEQ